MSSNRPSTSVIASLRESSRRSIAERTKSTLFIRPFPSEDQSTLGLSLPLKIAISYAFQTEFSHNLSFSGEGWDAFGGKKQPVLSAQTFAAGPIRGRVGVPG